MADLNQFIDPDFSSRDVAHSNGLGSGGASMSMASRYELRDREVRVVGSYDRSLLGRQRGRRMSKTADDKKGKTYDPSTDTFVDTPSNSNRQSSSIKDNNQIDKSVERRHQFTEPKARNFDKFR